jgi:hypothetical protein
VLETVSLPADVLAYPVEDWVAGLLKASPQRVGRKRAQALVTAYRDSIGVPGHASARAQWAAYWEHWRAACAALAATEAAQQALVASVPGADALRAIPGFGPVVIATLLGELGNLADYTHPQQAVRMAGLNGVSDNSDQYQGKTPRAKRGRPQVISGSARGHGPRGPSPRAISRAPGASGPESRVDGARVQTLAGGLGVLTTSGPLRCGSGRFPVHSGGGVNRVDIPRRLGRGRGKPPFGHVWAPW